MAITIEDAMRIGGLAQGQLLAGSRNLENTIEYIDLIEAPYSSTWNTEYYLYLTSFYSVKDDVAEQIRTVELLSENKCAGLVFQDYCLDHLAPEVIQRAEELGLPLIQVSKSVSWAQIIIPLSGAILREKSFLLERAQKTHKRLMDLVLKGGGLQEIASVLNTLIGHPLAIVDLRGNILASTSFDPAHVDIPLVLSYVSDWQMDKILNIEEQGVCIFGILSGNQRKVVGFFLINEPSSRIDQLDLVAIEQAATIAALVLVSQDAVVEAERRLRRDFVDDLLGGNYKSTEAIVSRAHSLGWSLAHKNTVVIVDLKYFEEYYLMHLERGEAFFQQIKEQLFEIVSEVVLLKMPDSILVDQSDSIIALPHIETENLIQAESSIGELAGLIQTEVRKLLNELSITIAIGGFYQTVEGLCQSYTEATQTLKVSRQLELEEQVVWNKDLAVYSILSQFAAESGAKNWLNQTLGSLLAYDRDNETDLVKTMETYFDANQRIKQAAYQLYIHPKTLSYRLKRITEILGTDPFDGHNQFSFYLATKLTRLQ